jgi:hypothetical protein
VTAVVIFAAAAVAVFAALAAWRYRLRLPWRARKIEWVKPPDRPYPWETPGREKD